MVEAKLLWISVGKSSLQKGMSHRARLRSAGLQVGHDESCVVEVVLWRGFSLA